MRDAFVSKEQAEASVLIHLDLVWAEGTNEAGPRQGKLQE